MCNNYLQTPDSCTLLVHLFQQKLIMNLNNIIVNFFGHKYLWISRFFLDLVWFNQIDFINFGFIITLWYLFDYDVHFVVMYIKRRLGSDEVEQKHIVWMGWLNFIHLKLQVFVVATQSCGQTWLANFMLLLLNVFFFSVFDIFAICMQMLSKL
jgi:hypothetical protein